MKKLITIALVLIGIGVVGLLALHSVTNVFSMETETLKETKTIPLNGIENVEISTSSTDVEVIRTNGDTIHVELSGEVSQTERIGEWSIETEGDRLAIDFPKEESGFSFHFGTIINQTKLTIALPKQSFDILKINSSSGNVDVAQVLSKQLTVETSSGDQSITKSDFEEDVDLRSSSGFISTANIKANTVQINTSSGDIENTKVNSKDFQVNSSSGDVEWREQPPHTNLKVETSSGDIVIELLQAPTSLALDYSSSSGEAKIKQPGFMFDQLSENRVKGSVGEGQYDMNIQSSSGDFTLR